MTLVTAQMSISLDGFYAGPKQDDPHDEDSEITHVRLRVEGRSALTSDERVPAAPGAET
jgi:hypothetical protein